jgi:hypothetical protein
MESTSGGNMGRQRIGGPPRHRGRNAESLRNCSIVKEPRGVYPFARRLERKMFGFCSYLSKSTAGGFGRLREASDRIAGSIEEFIRRYGPEVDCDKDEREAPQGIDPPGVRTVGRFFCKLVLLLPSMHRQLSVRPLRGDRTHRSQRPETVGLSRPSRSD